MHTNLFSKSTLAALVAATLFFGCPPVPPPDPLEPAPAVLSFTASATTVPVGTNIKLTWSVENATTVRIDELTLGAVSGVTGNSGEVEVGITGPSLFVLTARNARGASDSAVVSVKVGAAAGELLFAALPKALLAGQSSTLAWSAPGASAVTITATPGGTIDLRGQTASGSVTVSPTADTTYTLTAGVRSATTAVSVLPTLLSFTASSLSADAGSTVTLSWTSASAARVQLVAAGRGTLVDSSDAGVVASGSFTDTLPAQVDPGQLFSYELTVSTSTTTLKDSLTVSIAGNPAVVTFTAPPYARASTDGGVITLAWTTREADAVSIAAGSVEIYRAPAGALAGGTIDVPVPANDTTFVLTASNARGGQDSKTAAVDIVGLPTVTLTATPSTIMPGEPVTLSWSGTEVRNVRIVSPFESTLYAAAGVGDTGTAAGTYSFANTAVLRIEADNGAGDRATATTTVTVTNGVALTQPPGALRTGEMVALSWTGGTTITGLPHSDVVLRPGSVGFDDISTTGTALSLSSTDDAVGEIVAVGFSAPFFDRVVGERVWVNTNGYLSFGPINSRNYVETALPTAKLEPYSIAANWDDLFSVSVRWQIKPTTGSDRVLIVQWTVGTTKSFQVKLHSTGQIDLEYGTFTGTAGVAGVQGPNSRTAFPVAAPAVGQGITLFGPKTSPVSIPVVDERTLVGSMTIGTQTLPITHALGTVVQAQHLSFSEALVVPAAAVGAQGQWFELSNSRDTAIDLTGWSIGLTDGGVGAALSGTIAPRSVLVVGATTDRALNDDAGVQLALTGFDPGAPDAGVVTLSRGGGNLAVYSWANPTPGVALTTDFGPYKLSTEASALAAHPVSCLATASFGSQSPQQLGAPGVPNDCGFGYRWARTSGQFFDISGRVSATPLADVDEGFATVSLSPAPFPFFGTSQMSVRMAANGFLTFSATGSSSTFTSNSPSTTDANGLAVPFGGDLVGDNTTSAIYVERVGANVDPFAAAPHWVFQWSGWTHYDSFTFDDFNFQVKLFDDGTLEYQYGQMLSSTNSQLGGGSSSVTWLENPAGTQALVINANSFNPGVTPHSGIRFGPR